jgi:protein-tyrosine phosphatase
MIDIHSHLLFGVDDGSRTLEESVHVIKKLSEVGYTDIILTPHYINDSTYVSTREENLDVLKRLKVGLIRNNVNVNLYLGNEIYIDSEIANLLKNNIISSLNDTKYLLIELPMSGENEIYYDVFLDLINMGYKVILAHPERYISFQKDFNKVYELKELGVLLQSNVGSILGDYGRGAKKTIKRLLKENLITFMGTDIHHNKEEYTFVLKAKKKMGKYLTQKQINNIFENNAKVLLNDKIED